MKSLLKFATLFVLIVGGRLSKQAAPPVVVAQPQAWLTPNIRLVSQRDSTPSELKDLRPAKPAQAQVLSVFFK